MPVVGRHGFSLKNRLIIILIPIIMTLINTAARAESHELKSPDGRLLTGPNPLSMTLGDGKVLGRNARLEKADRKSVKDKIIPPVRIKSAVIEDVYNELTLTFAGSYFVVFRAYDDGVAYRFGTSATGPVTVMTEDIQYRFDKDHSVYFPASASAWSWPAGTGGTGTSAE